MIQLENLSLRRGSQLLLRNADVAIAEGQRVGLIGANGSGKSSLLAMLLSELSPDAGQIHIPQGWQIAHMAQAVAATTQNAIDFVLDGDKRLRAAQRALDKAGSSGDGHAIARAHAELENAGGYDALARGATLLHGLGFAAEVHRRPVAEFSGGWRVRLGLAQALMCPSDLLLLDEPTNHLDLEAVLWLEQWLRSYRGTMILISHDREFLDNTIDRVLHIDNQRITSYSGNYSDFERLRGERLASEKAAYDKQKREIAHMQAFIDRFRYKASKAKAAQSRLKAMERMRQIAPAQADSPLRFRFTPSSRVGDPLVQLIRAELGYEPGRAILRGSLTLRRGQRLGLLGPNGAGKSTLVRSLAGELPVLSGELRRHGNLQIGYFAQHQLEQLRLQESPLAHLRRISPAAPEQSLRNFLGGFGFTGDTATSPVAPLSGGEKSRLVLALIAWQGPDLLLLDEPTNHLDLSMRYALNQALQSFEGAVLLVSHDRHLLETTVDEYLLIADARIDVFDGDLGDYRAWLQRRGAAFKTPKNAANPNAKEVRRQVAEQRRQLQPLRREADRLLEEVENLIVRLETIAARLADPAIYEPSSQATLNELLREQGALQKALGQREQAWMTAEQAYEEARASPLSSSA